MIQQVTDFNIYPIFKTDVQRGVKTATIKLGDKTDMYKIGDELTLWSAWNERNPQKLGRIRLTEVKNKRIKHLTLDELNSEAPILRNIETLLLALSLIYKLEVTDNNWVTYLKWRLI